MKLTRLLACITLAFPLSASAQFLELYFYVPTNEPWPIPIFYDPITTGDFDGDGIDDVLTELFNVSYSQANGEFSVYEFTSPSDLGAQDITAADFTGNGYADIVTNSLYTQNLYSYLHINDGNGDIQDVNLIVPTANGNTVYEGATNQLTHADMDGDGIMDIVRTSGFGFDGQYYSSMVQILRNVDYTGEWEFHLASSYQVYQRVVTHLVLGDLSGNGREDVLYNWRINDFNSPVELRWVENNSTPGNIAFEPTTTIRSAFRPFAVSDVDGDGMNDILGFDIAGTQLSWLPNLGDGNFGEPVAINPLQNGVPTSIGSPNHLLAEDLNEDGHIDLVMGRLSFSGPAPIYILINDGSGQFSEFQQIPGGGGSSHIILADVTGNGVKELIRSGSNGIVIYRWPTTCTATAPSFLAANEVEGGVMLSWFPFSESVRCRIQAGTSLSGPFQFINVVGYELGEYFVPANLITSGVTYGWRVRCFCEGDPNDIPGPWSDINYVEYNPSDAQINTSVFPNPSMGEVRLSANVPDYTVRVFDLSGRKLLERYTMQNDLVIESGALSQGMYILIFDHQGVFSSTQLSIQQ